MSALIWQHQYASGESHSNFEFPSADENCSWFAPSTSGTVVITQVGGVDLTYVAVGGEVIRGKFTKLVSNTCTKLLCGNGEPPEPALATAGTSTASSLDTRISTAESGSTSLATRFSTVDSGETSADTSLASRFSIADSTLTSADSSLATRCSTLTSADTSLTSRISVAESVEASKG